MNLGNGYNLYGNLSLWSAHNKLAFEEVMLNIRLIFGRGGHKYFYSRLVVVTRKGSIGRIFMSNYLLVLDDCILYFWSRICP